MTQGMLQGRVVAVIGGTSGIGLAAVRACCAAGARMVASGRESADLDGARQELGSRARFLIAEACDSGATREVVALARREFGSLDALYHVAGGSGRRFGDGTAADVSDEAWRKTLELNLDSVFYSNRAALEVFLEQGRGGAILNMSSVLAFSPSPTHFATHAYAAAKAGVIGLSLSLASRYAGEGIRVNVIAPGLVDTPMARRAREDAGIMEYVRHKQPLVGGMAQARDLADAAVFLLSPSSRLVTGQVLAVDGGWSISEGRSH